VAAYLSSKPYEETFGPVTRQFTSHTVEQVHDLCPVIQLKTGP
jgi:hypothetical protein